MFYYKDHNHFSDIPFIFDLIVSNIWCSEFCSLPSALNPVHLPYNLLHLRIIILFELLDRTPQLAPQLGLLLLRYRLAALGHAVPLLFVFLQYLRLPHLKILQDCVYESLYLPINRFDGVKCLIIL